MAAQDDIQVNFSRTSYNQRKNFNNKRRLDYKPTKVLSQKQKQCILCKTAGRSYQGHDISSCWFISKFERLEIVDAFQVNVDEYDESLAHEEEINSVSGHMVTPKELQVEPVLLKVQCNVSPFFYAFYNHHVVKIVIDTGATSSLVSSTFVKRAKLILKPTIQAARQLDKSAVNVSGEFKFNLSFGDFQLPIEGLVNNSHDCDILAGVPFCKANNIDIYLQQEAISINGKRIPYGNKPEFIQHEIFLTETVILRNDTSRVLFPGEFIEICSDKLADYEDEEVAIDQGPIHHCMVSGLLLLYLV